MSNSKSNNLNAAPVRCYHNSSIGVDVHSKVLVCCAERFDPTDGTLEVQKAEFPTTMTGLKRFSLWCWQFDPEIVLMESTGVYWMSPYEALEDKGFDGSRLAVVKATDVKAALGRKTDKEDARRLAEFARIGRVKRSYIPPRIFREARCIARLYQKSIWAKTGAINRLHKVFCAFGCRPSSVFSDITGKTATIIIQSYVNDNWDDFVKTVMESRKIKATRAEILDVFQNHITPTQKRILKQQMRKVEQCEKDAAELLQMLEETLQPYEHLIERLMTIPGIKRTSALKILSELGEDLDSFDNIRNFCSWIGICPGNHLSAGKRYGSSVPKGNSYLKTYLVEVAQSIAQMRLDSTNLRKFFQALKERRGHNRAALAVGHKVARIIFALFKSGQDYAEKENVSLRVVRVKKFEQSKRNIEQLLGAKLKVSLAEEIPTGTG